MTTLQPTQCPACNSDGYGESYHCAHLWHRAEPARGALTAYRYLADALHKLPSLDTANVDDIEEHIRSALDALWRMLTPEERKRWKRPAPVAETPPADIRDMRDVRLEEAESRLAALEHRMLKLEGRHARF